MAVASEPRDLDEVDSDMDSLIGLANAGRDEMVKARLMTLVGINGEEQDRAVG